MPDLHGFFFQPTQSIQQLLPTIYVISIILVLMVGLWMIVNFVQQDQSRRLSWKRFRVLARRYSLNRQEISVLRKLALAARLAVPSRLLTSEDHFERIAHVMEKNGRRYEKRLIQSIRQKLYGRSVQPLGTKRSTDSLPAGTRLFIKYMDDPDTVLWGHLVDNDRQGLIVIVPSNREIRIPLRLNTHLEITAYVPNEDPWIFVSWVKSIIPGPRKMIVLGHSNFVISEKELKNNVRLVGPQFHEERSFSTPRSSNISVRKSSSRLALV